MHSPHTQKLIFILLCSNVTVQHHLFPLVSSQRQKCTKKDRNFHYCTCSTHSYVQQTREVKTCRAQYQLLQFVSAQAAPHWSCSDVLPCAPKALMECSMGLSMEAPLPSSSPHPPMSPEEPVSPSQGCWPSDHAQTVKSATAQGRDHAGTILSPSITCTETIPHTLIGKADL